MVVKEQEWKQKYIPCGVSVDGCPSCCQPVLRHPLDFILSSATNRLEGRDVAPFYVTTIII